MPPGLDQEAEWRKEECKVWRDRKTEKWVKDMVMKVELKKEKENLNNQAKISNSFILVSSIKRKTNSVLRIFFKYEGF